MPARAEPIVAMTNSARVRRAGAGGFLLKTRRRTAS